MTLEPFWEEDPLDKLSNRVVGLVAAGQLDEADAVCDELAARYSGMIDHLERRAMALDARGEATEGARCYRLAADHARTHPGFEPSSVQYWRASPGFDLSPMPPAFLPSLAANSCQDRAGLH